MFASCILRQPWYFFFFKVLLAVGMEAHGRPLNSPWMFPECSLKIPWMFPECFLNVPWMFTECSLNVHWMFPECRKCGRVWHLGRSPRAPLGRQSRKGSSRKLGRAMKKYTERRTAGSMEALNVSLWMRLVNIQWTFSAHSVHIQWTFSEHSVSIPCTFSAHSVNIQGTSS